VRREPSEDGRRAPGQRNLQAQARGELVGLELVGGERWAAEEASHEGRRSGSERLCLDLVELRLGDRSAVEEALGVGDLAGDVA
jgi:hypothetical protein